jgi:type II secretory pathway pseudopilin PulG
MSVLSHQSSVISKQGGFTLLEVLLASFIFMSVVTVAVGSFTSQITLQSSSEAQRSAQQTAQSIVEAISRDIKTLEGFEITAGSCPSRTLPGTTCGSKIDIFDPSDPNGPGHRRYWLQPGQNEIRFCTATCSSENALTDRTKIEVLTFRVEGIVPDFPSRASQTVQPFVMLHLDLRTVAPTGAGPEATVRLVLRTLVTSRLFDKYTNTPPN